MKNEIFSVQADESNGGSIEVITSVERRLIGIRATATETGKWRNPCYYDLKIGFAEAGGQQQ